MIPKSKSKGPDSKSGNSNPKKSDESSSGQRLLPVGGRSKSTEAPLEKSSLMRRGSKEHNEKPGFSGRNSDSRDRSSSSSSFKARCEIAAGPNNRKSIHDDRSKSDQDDKLDTSAPKHEIAPMLQLPKKEPNILYHPLESKWQMWFFSPEKGKAWEDCQRPFAAFDTVEHFWSLMNNIMSPSELSSGTDLSLFKNNWRPMWEDPINKNGGRLIINVQRGRHPLKVDEVWLEVLMFLVGENFEYSEDVCGAVVSHRAYGDKVAIWTSNKIVERVKSIGYSAKEKLGLDVPPIFTFEEHEATRYNATVFGKASSKTLFTV